MRALGVVVAIVGLVAACRPEAAETRSANYANDRNRILRDARSKAVVPLCKGDTDGYRACGLLVFDFREQSNQDRFSSQMCGGIPVRDDKTCFDLYAEGFLNQLKRRYDLADAHDIKVACASEFDCTQWEQMELAWLQSHNGHVFAAARRELAARGEQDDRDRSEVDNYDRQMRAASAAFAGASAGMNQGLQSSGCTSSSGCPMGHVCMVPAGATTGSCMKPK